MYVYIHIDDYPYVLLIQLATYVLICLFICFLPVT